MTCRILTNGLNFRVQWLGKTWLLRRRKWFWLRRLCPFALDYYVADFDSEEEAEQAAKEAEKQFNAKEQGYQVLESAE